MKFSDFDPNLSPTTFRFVTESEASKMLGEFGAHYLETRLEGVFTLVATNLDPDGFVPI